jgi:DNA-3-methyladenine glycosylase I
MPTVRVPAFGRSGGADFGLYSCSIRHGDTAQAAVDRSQATDHGGKGHAAAGTDLVDMTAAPDLVVGDDGNARCRWGASDDLYRAYHDTEWGRPVTDERGLYEKLCLECLQSGLSWALILRKRDGIRDAFAGFDPDTVAAFGAAELAALLQDPRVIRNRRKLEAIVRNAEATVSMRDETPLPELVWSFRLPDRAAAPRSYDDLAPTTPESKALAKELKRRGFVFVGPTTVYSTMQAVGVVNDHLAGCFVRDDVEAARRGFSAADR